MAAGLALLSRSPAGQTRAIWNDKFENYLRISFLVTLESSKDACEHIPNN